MRFTAIATIAVAAALSAGAASAAVLSFAGVGTSQLLTNSYDNQRIAGYDGFDPDGVGKTGSQIETINGVAKNAMNGLSVSTKARVTYTFLGSEAGNTNYAAQMGSTFFTKGSPFGATFTVADNAGLLDFGFGTTAPNSRVSLIRNDGVADPAQSNYAIGYSAIFNGGASVLVFFDDIAAGDRDFDDMAMRIDVAPVPVPAAGLLLAGALAGFGALRRRRAA